MKQWDVFYFPFTRERRHPAVILTNDEFCENAQVKEVNVLLCASAEANQDPKKIEVVLDQEDGFDWKTVVRCHKIYLLEKSAFQERIGNVIPTRRRLISRKIAEVFRLPLA
jgi:mRNA-degrading endonuclease toxin of MazEF toxin-antitoxin module